LTYRVTFIDILLEMLKQTPTHTITAPTNYKLEFRNKTSQFLQVYLAAWANIETIIDKQLIFKSLLL